LAGSFDAFVAHLRQHHGIILLKMTVYGNAPMFDFCGS